MIKVYIEKFLELAKQYPVVDVRSPSEFKKGHIPKAISLPLFDDIERTKVGTVYKQQGQEKAIFLGLDFVGKKLPLFYKSAKKILKEKGCTTLLIHCWRGGMRSASMANFLTGLGIKTIILSKGYKAYRYYVRQLIAQPYRLIILGGKTGSAKTDILLELKKTQQVIDLEGLANHKGSAFGSAVKDNIRSNDSQPTTETFENNLAFEISKLDLNKIIWVENESRLIGRIHLPLPFLEKMKVANYVKIEIPISMRISYLAKNYGVLPIGFLKASAKKIEKRLGGDRLKLFNSHLDNDQVEQAVAVILDYYDRSYEYACDKRTQNKKFDLKLNTINSSKNSRDILEYVKKKTLTFNKKLLT